MVHVSNLGEPWDPNVGSRGNQIHFHQKGRRCAELNLFIFKDRIYCGKFTAWSEAGNVKRFSAVVLHFLVREKQFEEMLKGQGHTQLSA